MGRSRYPRRGHRLAPATLRELLQVPVPEKFLGDHDAASPPMLADLDESAWQRYDKETCQQLAGEVVQTVGQAARMPMAIADRPLPPLPQGMKLTDLELEVRTINCLVSAGMHERPQDLRSMTIEGILGLRGFWVKCLVDLLTSMEFVNDHPEARKAMASKSSPPLKGPRRACRYPRAGHRLAPQLLREILTDYVPASMARGTPVQGLRLGDLDETVWEHLSPQDIAKLAEMIVARVNVSGYNRVIQNRRIPKPPKGVRLEDLRLENRTYNCLRREGFGKRPEDLGKRTIGDLLSVKAFGAKCLVDLLTSLETLVSREGKLDQELTAQASALGEIPEAAAVHFSDPRLGDTLRATDAEANTVGELVDHVVRRRLDPPDPLRLYEQICHVRRRIEELTQLSLEEELVQIFSPSANQRDREIIAEYYGWDGGGGHTLEELGKKYDLSRERIRQVCVRAVKRLRGANVFAPVLDRALAFVAERLPCELNRLQEQFDETGLSKGGLSLEVVQQAASFLDRKPDFAVVPVGDVRLAVHPETARIPRAIVQVAKRVVLSYGATTVGDVAAELPKQFAKKADASLILETLKTLPDFQWLDEQRGWFRLESLPQYGLPNMIEKILSVTGRIDVAKLRGAVARYRRTGRKVPPSRVLLEFCRQMSGVRVEGNAVIADPPLDWREVLAGVERGMVEVLTEHGPVMERGEFEERCIENGMNRFSFNAIIMCSPVITQYGRSVYGLLGQKVDRKTIEALAARKPGTAPTKVLKSYGATDDGRVYLAYRLSKAAISGGVITVPAAMSDRVRGRFAIETADGEASGTLVSKNGCAWGLGPVLRGQAAEPGDHLLILFDLARQQAQIYIGNEDILAPISEMPQAGPDLGDEGDGEREAPQTQFAEADRAASPETPEAHQPKPHEANHAH